MGILDVFNTLVQVPTLLALKRGMRLRSLDERDCFAAHIEATAARIPDHPAVIFEGRTISWRELNALANRYARVFKSQGLKPGDSASVLMENRIEFLATVIALNKLGVVGALINTNLRGRPLVHCVSVTESSKCIFGAELAEPLAEIKAELALEDGADFLWVPDGDDQNPPGWALNLAELSGAAMSDNLPDTAERILGDNAFYVFTSGTTGLPKAAVLSNRRYLNSAMLSHKAGLKCAEKDRIYICLPLYHSTGLMIGVGAAFSSGASIFLRRRFSASNFLREVREHQTNCFVYIGELCRYLVNTEARPDDHRNPLTRAIGNGLRPDIWHEFKSRFGLKRITEFYGSSEGNVAFANVLNKDCTVGMTSARIALVEYDVAADEIVKDAAGYCIEVQPGTPGLLLGHINEEAVFEGYTSKEATESKILRNVFAAGDAWFNSGDLMKTVDVGFSLGFDHYQFVDRVGDTFRWKSENVSTSEVSEIINGFPGIRYSNVYGVSIPGADGRAGMAALALEGGTDSLELEAFSRYVNQHLPAYARPIFLRLESDIDVTGTFKMVKGKLREEGYDPARVSDPLFVLKPGASTYEPLDAEYAALIARGAAGY